MYYIYVMKARKIIAVVRPNVKVQYYTTFTSACKAEGLPYHYLKPRKFPIEYKGIMIERIYINEYNRKQKLLEEMI